jgi:uncharacterized protein YdaU (DUF1376 family)
MIKEYFSHDYSARSDERIKLLIRKHGILGYGIFWAIIEDLYQNENSLRNDYAGIAFELRVDEKMIESILNDFDLFVFENDFFYSLSVERRLNERNTKSAKARESANSRWSKTKEDANAMRTQCDSNAIKEKNSKEKNNKEKEKRESVNKFTPPTLDEVILYFKQNGYSPEAGQKAFSYYDCAGWSDSQGRKIKNWKQKMHGVWFKPESLIGKEQKKTRTVIYECNGLTNRISESGWVFEQQSNKEAKFVRYE